MRNINSSKLTKNNILDRVSQVDIFATYFNISKELIEHCITTGELILSPIRVDHLPTFGFRYDNRGKLKAKDFAGYFWGDCFDAVAHIISEMYKRDYNISNKRDFMEVLRHISLTFKYDFYGSSSVKGINTNEIYKALNSIKHKKPIIELVVREWDDYDKKYWSNIGVNFNVLNTHFVYPVDQYYINRSSNPTPKYYYSPTDPCYAYSLGKDRHGIDGIKLYFPKRKHGDTRFITNCNHFEGIYNLDRDDYYIIVITKSTKDRVALVSHLIKMKKIIDINIGVINIPHETYNIKQNEFRWLTSKLSSNGVIVSLMDNDDAGVIKANQLKESLGIIPILIPVRFKAKDFAEFRSKHSVKETSNNIIKVINYIKHEKDRKCTWWGGESYSIPF